MNAPQKPTCAVLMAVYRNDDPADLNLALKSIGPDQSHAPGLICIVFDGWLKSHYQVLAFCVIF